MTNENADGSIVVTTDLDTKGFEAGSDRTKNAIDSVNKSFEKMGEKVRDTVSDSTKAMSDAAPIVEKSVQDSINVVDQLANRITQLDDAVSLKQFNAQLERTARQSKSVTVQMQALEQSYTAAMNGNSKNISAFETKARKIEAKLADIKSRMQELEKQKIVSPEYAELEKQAEKAEAALLKLYDRQDRMKAVGVKSSSQTWKNLQYEIQNAEELVERYEKQVSDMQSNGTAYMSGTDSSEYVMLNSALEDMTNTLSGMQSAVSSVKAETETATEKTNQFAENNKRAWSEIKGDVDTANNTTQAFERECDSIGRSVSSLEGKVDALEPAAKRAMGGSESAVYSFENKVVTAGKALSDARQALDELGNAKIPTEQYTEINTAIEELRARLNEYIAEQQNMLSDGVSRDSDEWEILAEKIDAARESIYEYEAEKMRLEYDGQSMMSGVDTVGYQDLEQRILSAENAVSGYENQVAKANRGTSALSATLKGMGKIGAGAFQKLGNKIKSTISQMKIFTRHSNTSMEAVKKLTKVFTSFGARIKSLLKRRFISSIISGATAGIKNLAQVSPQLNTSISSVTSALTRLKNSFATAFAPIITTVAPILTMLINLLAEAFTKLGMFIAALTGATSFKKAVAVQEDYAESLNETAKASDKASKSLAGFDELNNSTTNDTSENNTTNPADMFEDVPIDSKIADFAKKLKNAFLSGDFEGIGELLADKINGIFQKINKAVDWNNVGPAITAFVEGITRTFNSLLDNIDWALIGDTFAKRINTIVNTLYLLVTGIDWANLGKKLMEGFNALVYGIDWKNLVLQ